MKEGVQYLGTLNESISGYPCQKWSSQTPTPHNYYTDQYIEDYGVGDHNYCRKVDQTGYISYLSLYPAVPWCYLDTDKHFTSYEQCKVPKCAKNGKSPNNKSGHSQS